MGNVNEKNIARERMKSGSQDLFPGSPLKEGQAFTFDKKPLSQGSSQDDDETSALSRSVPPGNYFHGKDTRYMLFKVKLKPQCLD